MLFRFKIFHPSHNALVGIGTSQRVTQSQGITKCPFILLTDGLPLSCVTRVSLSSHVPLLGWNPAVQLSFALYTKFSSRLTTLPMPMLTTWLSFQVSGLCILEISRSTSRWFDLLALHWTWRSVGSRTEVKFCGELIGGGKRTANTENLSVIREMQKPQTKTELRRLLGFFFLSRAYTQLCLHC